MPLKKKRPVLYEVARRREIAAGLRAEPRPAEPAPQPQPQPAKPPVSRLAPAQSAPVPHKPAPAPADPLSPTVEIERGQVNLSLRWPAMTIIGACLVMSLAVAFQLGRHWAGGAAEMDSEGDALALFVEDDAYNDAAQPAPGKDPALEVAPPKQQPPQNQPPVAPVAFDFEPGKYYVKVQHFPKSRQQHAVDACKYLRTAGVPSHVWKRPDEFVLVATEPFDSSAAARQLIRRIQAVGVEYVKEGGGYDFQGSVARKIR